MHIKKQVILFILLLTLLGCTQNNGATNHHTNSTSDGENVEFTKYSQTSSDDFINQDIANKAKQTLSKDEDIKAIKAVNTPDALIVGVKVHHNKRLQLDKLRKKFSKTIKKKFPKIKTTVSTDKKVWIELGELEQAINTNKISNKQLQKEVKHITKLTKKKT